MEFYISDVIYVTQVRIYDIILLYVAIFCLFLSSFAFINELIKRKAYPKFIVEFPGKYIFTKVLWLNYRVMSPIVDGEIRGFEKHDNILKVFGFFGIWAVFIILQLLWIIFYIIWLSLHSIIYGPWLVFGLLLYQLKAMCVKRVFNF